MTKKNNTCLHKRFIVRFSVFVSVVLFSLICLCIAFYYTAIIRLTNIMGFANSGQEVLTVDERVISKEDFFDLSFVSPVDPDIDYFINGGWRSTIQSIGFMSITISGVVNYTVINAQDSSTIENIENNEFVVQMRFSQGKWIIIAVDRN